VARQDRHVRERLVGEAERRSPQREDDRARVGGGHRGDVAKLQREARMAPLGHVAVREDDVLGGQRPAVVPAHAPSQAYPHGPAVAADRLR
jgi:hypothetical protein